MNLTFCLEAREIPLEILDVLGTQEVAEPPTYHFLPLIPQHIEPGLIDLEEMSAFIERLITNWRAFIQELEAFFTLSQDLLGPLTLGDVAARIERRSPFDGYTLHVDQ
jgi:hypothetical protein